MDKGKFIDLPEDEQRSYVHEHFTFDAKQEGWLNNEGLFCGRHEDDVIAALIDLEDAEINSIGDCMSGYCVTPPKLADFVRKPE